MALDRRKIAQQRGWAPEEIYKAIDAWRALYKRQPASTMTLEEYLDLMQSSGIRPSMIGLHRGKYSLARIDDIGAYHKNNCRFLTIEQNVAERKEGYQSRPEFRIAMSEIALKRPRHTCHYCGGAFTKGMLTRWHGDKCKTVTSN